MPQPFDTYLDDLSRIRGLPGTRETSYYPAVANLLNQVGEGLRPKVYCLHHPSGGDGIPDFGLFEQTLFRRGESPEWRAGIAPDRGVVEVKGADHRIQTLLDSEQVRERYLPAYGLVLATNLWQYRLVDEAGRERERFDLANDETGFCDWCAGHGLQHWRAASMIFCNAVCSRGHRWLDQPMSPFPRLLRSRGADAA
jgi:hypothetical protein